MKNIAILYYLSFLFTNYKDTINIDGNIAICRNAEGKVIVQGNCYGTTVLLGDDSLTFSFSESTNKMFIAEFEPSLDYDWGITSSPEVIVGSTTNGNAGGISSHGSDTYYCGAIPGHAVFGNDTIDASYDMFVGKAGMAATGTEGVSSSDLTVSVYPNPASQTVRCNWNSRDSNSSVSLTDMEGRRIFQQFYNAGIHSSTFDVSALREGIYMLQWSGGKTVSSEKVMVVH